MPEQQRFRAVRDIHEMGLWIRKGDGIDTVDPESDHGNRLERKLHPNLAWFLRDMWRDDPSVLHPLCDREVG